MAESGLANAESSACLQSDCNAQSENSAAGSGYAEIIVVRHGETEWNADGRIQGHLDVELNEVGRRQAAAVIKDSDLRERHLGELQGLVFRKAVKLEPKAYKAFLSHRTDQEIPGGGESLDQLYERCTSALQKIGNRHQGECVVVVTHGGVVRTLYERAVPSGNSPGKIGNTSVSVFHLSNEEDWLIKTWNDTSHLSETGFLENAFGGDGTSG
ncbi:hypothetical protein Sjap_022193 [Stephania japonica]|uniref:Phosphoglycerate mutase n=1 Tax=Stephania japonica TaxID=461633 RepID=A0AAP0ENF6_9MAGN